MSSLYKSPGVHIESAGDRFIPLEEVETGVTAFLGVTQQGPRQTPIRVGSFEQYEKVFGAADGFMTAGVRGFFDNGGKTAFILNVEAEGGFAEALGRGTVDFTRLKGGSSRQLRDDRGQPLRFASTSEASSRKPSGSRARTCESWAVFAQRA